MKRQWRNGPPPSIGWWPASTFQDEQSIRWWDGRYWSFYAYPEDTAKFAAGRAQLKVVSLTKLIQWTDRWWL